MPVQLVFNEFTGKCIIIESQDQYRHKADKIKHGLTPILKAKLIEFEELGLKPAQMLVNLRKFAEILPSKLQLNTNGTQIFLQNFCDFYENNKEVPEDSDKMFVAYYYVGAAM
jgi:hypothetical protein